MADKIVGPQTIGQLANEVSLFPDRATMEADLEFMERVRKALDLHEERYKDAYDRYQLGDSVFAFATNAAKELKELEKQVEKYYDQVSKLPGFTVDVTPKLKLSEPARRFFDDLVNNEFREKASAAAIDAFQISRGRGRDPNDFTTDRHVPDFARGSDELIRQLTQFQTIAADLIDIRTPEQMIALAEKSYEQFDFPFNFGETKDLVDMKEKYTLAVNKQLEMDRRATVLKEKMIADELALIISAEQSIQNISGVADTLAADLGGVRSFKDVREAAENFFENMTSTIREEFIRQSFTNPLKAAIEGFVAGIVQQAQTAFIQSQGQAFGASLYAGFSGFLGGLFGAGGGGGPGGLSSLPTHPDVLHSGGVVPKTGRYGLIKGERVLSNPQQARIPNTGPASGIYLKPQVNINNTQSDKVGVSVEEGDDGSLNINLYDAMDNMLAQTMAKPGNFQETVLGVTGARRPLLSR